MNSSLIFYRRHPLLTLALPHPAHSPLARAAQGEDEGWNAAETALAAGHEDMAALMHSARSLGGNLMQRQLQHLWPKAAEREQALAQGLGVALWLTEMLLFVREDAAAGCILLPRETMRHFLVEEQQLIEDRHDFALRRLAEHLAAQIFKILQGSAPLGLSAPWPLRLRLRWTMLYTGFLLNALRHDPNTPFIRPKLPAHEGARLIAQTLFPPSRRLPRNHRCSR